jgi:hypothetical protein
VYFRRNYYELLPLKRFQNLEFEPRYEFSNGDCTRKYKDGLRKAKEIFTIYMNEIKDENYNRAMDSIREKIEVFTTIDYAN